MRKTITLAGCLVLFALSSCTPANETTTESAPAAATPNETPPGVLSMHYIDAAAALAADDLEKAKASLSALAKESTGEMKTLAQAAANTGDIAATRERFKPLSALAVTMELPKDYAVAFCPMYRGGSKWVQKKDKLANPYYGSAMLTCGTFVN